MAMRPALTKHASAWSVMTSVVDPLNAATNGLIPSSCKKDPKDEFGFHEVIRKLQQELVSCKEQMTNLHERESTLCLEVQELKESQARVRQENEELSNDMQIMLEENSDLHRDLIQSQQEVRDLQMERDRIAEKLWEERESSTLNEEADTKIWNLVAAHKNEFQKLVQSRTQVEHELEACREEKEALEEHRFQLMDENSTLKKNLANFAREHEQQTEVINSLRTMINTQCIKLCDLEQESLCKSDSSEPSCRGKQVKRGSLIAKSIQSMCFIADPDDEEPSECLTDRSKVDTISSPAPTQSGSPREGSISTLSDLRNKWTSSDASRQEGMFASMSHFPERQARRLNSPRSSLTEKVAFGSIAKTA